MHCMLNLSITFSFVDLQKISTDSATSNTQSLRNKCLEEPVKNIVTVLMKGAGKKVSFYFWILKSCIPQ